MARARRLLGVLALLVPAAAQAQALSCRIDAPVALPHADAATPDQPRRLLPIGGYTLAISWSPEYCHGPAGRRDRFQCGGGNRFGFTLHGLWPDGKGKDWPQYCRPAALLPMTTIRRNLCATPSAQLLQHEWAKHGTCVPGTDPDRYFARSTGLFGGLHFPDMDALSRQPDLNAGAVAEALAAANPGIAADGVRITANRRGWLEEAWLCLDTNYKPQRCPAQQGGLAPSAKIKIQREH